MDNFDNELKRILKKEINKPLLYEDSIKNAFSKKETKTISHYLFYKVAVMACCLIMGCTGVMAASYILYEKIWKDPVVVSNIEEEEKVKETITDSEKAEFITEEKAIEIGNQLLDKLGYKNEKITQISLVRAYDSENSIHYLLRSENILINLDPKNGELEYFGDNSILSKNIKCDNISEDDAKKIATNVYTNLEIFSEKDNYEIVDVKRQKIVSGKNINDLWQVSFAKIYNGNYDKTNYSTISFAVVNNNLVIYTITGKNDNNFEDNPIIISKEEAIEIAKNKEKEFSDLEISNVSAELSIEKMNIFVYCLENNITNENGELKVDNISRNVWVVNIEHNKDSKPKDGNLETVKSQYNKKYYIDTTTGEIIGREQSEFFND